MYLRKSLSERFDIDICEIQKEARKDIISQKSYRDESYRPRKFFHNFV